MNVVWLLIGCSCVAVLWKGSVMAKQSPSAVRRQNGQWILLLGGMASAALLAIYLIVS